MNDFVSARGVSKVYRRVGVFQWEERLFCAVDDVSLTIAKGDILGLVGESGSGKTTLARALLYLDPPTSGTVAIAGLDPRRLYGRQMRQFRRVAQMIFQDVDRSLDPRMTVFRSISEALANHGTPRESFRDRTAELLDLVGMDPGAMDNHPWAFSGGQRQRIVVARALAMEPEFLVLDEPVSNLDVSIQAQIVNLLLSLRRKLNLTYLFISHDLNLVSYLSDTIAVMKDGRIVEQGEAEKLIRSPSHPYTRALFAAAPRLVIGGARGTPRRER